MLRYSSGPKNNWPLHLATLKTFLDTKVVQYNRLDFIQDDPILIPHGYQKQQDIEIAGLWAAVLAWGQRKVIISKCQELLRMMDHEPYDFILHHRPSDLRYLRNFRHRTFNATDALYFIRFLKHYYQRHDTLEEVFFQGMSPQDTSTKHCLIHFYDVFCSLQGCPDRTRKHVATPKRQSACKRMNMFLRWMVRHDNQGVDFGLWKRIKPHQLVCPCDVHVVRVAQKLGLLKRKSIDWKAAVALTQNLKILCPIDPVKYDFALFGLGAIERF
ncbi:MAG: TIGR02757 family protein [Bacteroidota bacterium]